MSDEYRKFDDFDTTIMAGGASIPVRITKHALHAIWGAGAGPQTAQAIFDQNRTLFDEAVADKLLAGDTENGVVVISDFDLGM